MWKISKNLKKLKVIFNFKNAIHKIVNIIQRIKNYKKNKIHPKIKQNTGFLQITGKNFGNLRKINKRYHTYEDIPANSARSNWKDGANQI